MFVNVLLGYFNKWFDNVFLNCFCYELIKFVLGMDVLGELSFSCVIYVIVKFVEFRDRIIVELYYFIFLFYKNIFFFYINYLFF